MARRRSLSLTENAPPMMSTLFRARRVLAASFVVLLAASSRAVLRGICGFCRFMSSCTARSRMLSMSNMSRGLSMFRFCACGIDR